MRVHIHGNCQSYVMCHMLREVLPKWDFSYFEVHADPIITKNDEYHEAIKTADIILTQPIHEGYRGRSDLSTDWIKSTAKPGAEVIVIAAMHFEGHHPSYGQLSALGDFCFDSLAAHLVAVGVRPSEVVSILLSEDLFDEQTVQQEINLSIDEMLRREIQDGIDILFSPFSEYFSSSTQLFHIINHPARPLYTFMINAFLERLSNPTRVSFEGKDYQSAISIPMYPTIAAQCKDLSDPPFSGTFRNDRCVYLHGHSPMTQSSYFERMVDQLMQHSSDRILSAIKSSWKSVAFLKRLARSNRPPPGVNIWNSI